MIIIEKTRNKNRIVLILVAITLFVTVFLILAIPRVVKEVSVNGILPEYTSQEMMEYASLIAEGEVIASSDPFTVMSSDGVQVNYVDYEFRLDQVFRGEVEAGSVSVRIPGGQVGDYIYNDESSAKIENGEKLILFLYQPKIGGSTLTEGDYYLILGDSQGVYEQAPTTFLQDTAEDNENIYLNSDFTKRVTSNEESAASYNSKSIVDSGGITKDYISVSDFENTMEEFNMTVPVNKYWFRDDVLDSIQYNLENGMITQEEYDLYMQQTEEYGTVINE